MGQWESISAFISMGGYGQYVWGSYGMVLFCFICVGVLPMSCL